MAQSFDAVVIGAGLMGAASTWELTRRGRSVLLLEQYPPRHDRGSSHGSARIVRRAYGDALYTRLTGRAFELWRELELASGAQVIRPYGGLDFGTHRNVPAIAAHLAEAGVAHEVLPAAEAQHRWPGLRFEGDVLFHPQAGVLDAALAVDSFLAQTRGADVRFERAATAITPDGDGARVTLDDGTEVTARVVVVAAGAWAPGLLASLVDLPPLRVTEQTVLHFPRRDPAAEPWPTVIHEAEQAVYHLAGGRDGGADDDRKIGVHDGGPDVTGPRGPNRTGVADDGLRAELVRYVRDWLPGLVPEPRSETTCLYTMTPSEDFLLDRVGPVVVCSPCSGHGAKFAPLIGGLVADLVEDGAGDLPERFRLATHLSGRRGAVSL